MEYFTKWPDVYAIRSEEAPTVANALVTNCCRFGVPRELHSDQGRNFESRLMQEVFERLGTSKTRTTPLHPQSDGMVERYVKTVKEHLRKVLSTHHRDWDERLPIFLLTNRASTHETRGTTPASMVSGRELCLPCDLLFVAPHDKEQCTTDNVVDLEDRLHGIHHQARQHLTVASDRISPNPRDSRKGTKPGCTTRIREDTRAPVIMGRPIRGDHSHQRRALPHPATSQGGDDGGTRGQTVAIPGGSSRRAASIIEQFRGRQR
jgi:hypothetical protein